ncbi:hypothetical protein PR048_008503 [Dryococelus australis]|uniref:Uncharacterized protein n=1 Tax=Dryococelus australis TaxID=614101 RepID=A0ABQ9HXA5_9NEOP|nr:hypothetical protein PR048_008503 [Dryococelus australis]
MYVFDWQAEDGSEESSSEEKELEEPMSITSQESSSQELESDSKQSPTVEQEAVVLASQETNVLPLQADQEKTIFVCSKENTDIKPVASQQGLTNTDCERQEWRIGSSDTALVNGVSHSDSSDTSYREVSKKASTPSPQLSSPQTPLSPLTPPPTPAAATQESPPDIGINGYTPHAVTETVANKTKALDRNTAEVPSPSRIETLNNATNKIKSGKPSQDQKKKQEAKKSNTKNACNVNGKQSGGKARKENKQRNLQNGYLPNLTSKMDGNENISRCKDQVEKIPRGKAAGSLGNQQNCLQQEPVPSDCSFKKSKTEEETQRYCNQSMEFATYNLQVAQQKFVASDKIEINQPPNKPVRKDLCKTTKSLLPDLPQSKQTVNVAECLEDTVAADKLDTEHGGNFTQSIVACSSTAGSSHGRESMDTTPKQDESKESLWESACKVELGTKHLSENVKEESQDLRLGASRGNAKVQEEKHTSSVYLSHFTGAINVSSTEDEREAEPPPIPPPRRKRWRTSARRQSLERAPTPGRELEVSTDMPESVSDESSLSSSTQSEESVIELLSSMPTSPDAEAKTRSSEDDDLIYARKPLDKFENMLVLQPTLIEEEKSSTTQISVAEIEKYADVLSCKIILEAVEDAALECSRNTRPITHAVTRWLRSQSPEEVLSLPSREHSESEFDDTDISGGSTEDIADVRKEMQTGSKNVHRNPLPASSLKISCKLKNVDGFDGASRRVAKKSGYQTKVEKKTVKDETVKIFKNSDGCNEKCYDKKLSQSIEQNKLPKNCVHTENVSSEVQMFAVNDESFLSDLSECEGEWDLWDCRSIKPSSMTVLSNKVEELSLPTESPEDRRTAMCDPTLSVAKYYSLGAAVKSAVRPEENSDTMSECGSEEEVDALYHFRNEIEDTDMQHQTLASELACSYEPLPKHWAVDPVTVLSGKLEDSAFEKKYLPDSGVQSEESGDEVTIGSNAQRINLKANLLHHQSAILMSHLQGDGPFPCGGICCILQ